MRWPFEFAPQIRAGGYWTECENGDAGDRVHRESPQRECASHFRSDGERALHCSQSMSFRQSRLTMLPIASRGNENGFANLQRVYVSLWDNIAQPQECM